MVRKESIFLFLLIVSIFAVCLVSCDPVGDYLIEITGVTYYDGYVVIGLSPAYGGLRLQNFGITHESGNVYEIEKISYRKEKENIYYFLKLDDNAVFAEGYYFIRVEKAGFRFIHTDCLQEANLVQFKVSF